jgi:uncharacterized protein YxjI
MKQLIINQQLFALGNKFQITDGDNQPVFAAREEFMTFTQQCDLYTLAGQLIYHIQRRYFRIFGRYDLNDGNKENVLGMLRGRIHWPFVRRFRLTTEEGNFYVKTAWMHVRAFTVDENFKINDKEPVLKIVKKVRIRDVYKIDYDETKMSPKIAAVIGLCFDMLYHSKGNKHSLLSAD